MKFRQYVASSIIRAASALLIASFLIFAALATLDLSNGAVLLGD